MTNKNSVHPTASVEPGVSLGARNVVGAFAVLTGRCSIGDDNWIGPHAVIGTPAQIRGGPHEAEDVASEVGITIGDRNVIREFTTVHQPHESRTSIGSDCYLMAYCHIAHDVTVGNGVTIANAVQLGGHATLGAGANLGLGVMVHQRIWIGPGAMAGMGAIVTRDLPPHSLSVGNPARLKGANVVGLARAGYPAEVASLVAAYLEVPSPETLGKMPAEIKAAFEEYLHVGEEG